MLNLSYKFFLNLMPSSMFDVIIITMSPPGSHASTEQSRQENSDMREISQGLWGRQQQQQREDEIKGKAYIEVTISNEIL